MGEGDSLLIEGPSEEKFLDAVVLASMDSGLADSADVDSVD